MILRIPESDDVSVSQLRGIWGEMLHKLAPPVFGEMFPPKGSSEDSAGYTFSKLHSAAEIAVRWTLIGNAIRHDAVARRALEAACIIGLGPKRLRFYVERMDTLRPDSLTTPDGELWTLNRCRWPSPLSIHTPCCLTFPAPLRLIYSRKLIKEPTLVDVIIAIHRRIGFLLPKDCRDSWDELQTSAMELARWIPARPWVGGPCDLHRWSGSQKTQLQLRGIIGSLELTEGPQDLWPLLAAALWLQVGKATTMGMGQMIVEPISRRPNI